MSMQFTRKKVLVKKRHVETGSQKTWTWKVGAGDGEEGWSVLDNFEDFTENDGHRSYVL